MLKNKIDLMYIPVIICGVFSNRPMPTALIVDVICLLKETKYALVTCCILVAQCDDHTVCPPPQLVATVCHILRQSAQLKLNVSFSMTSPLELGYHSSFVNEAMKLEMADAIANLANASFTSDQFPDITKHGLVVPLLKKPGLAVAGLKKFRPVRNLSPVSNILERLVMTRLKSNITVSSNFYDLQSAYRKGHSTLNRNCSLQCLMKCRQY